MALISPGAGNPNETAAEHDQLECPRCRRLDGGPARNGTARCPTCGSRLIASTRQSETDAWTRLYGRPPARLR